MTGIPIIAIGRNEGERLKVCLRTCLAASPVVVYVDSGSTDGSVEHARSAGAQVVELDPARPFGPSRARNQGFAKAMEIAPDAPFVQFIDGDCELMAGWMDAGVAALEARPDVAAVCGTVREMFPEASCYNKLADLEWRKDPGEIDACAGRFMARANVFAELGGFRTDVIAAEDDEFCIRLRRAGWKILQVDMPMARHDVAMMRFSQWWRRASRTGFAYAQVAAMHGAGEERTFVREVRRIWGWGLWTPLLTIVLAPISRGFSVLVALEAYSLVFSRIYGYGRKRGWSAREALLYAWFTTLSKFPGLVGLLEFRAWRRNNRRANVSNRYYDYKI